MKFNLYPSILSGLAEDTFLVFQKSSSAVKQISLITLGMPLRNIAAMKASPVSLLSDGTLIKVSGYETPGDGGGGNFIYNSSSTDIVNLGTVFAPNSGAGRFIRSYNGDIDVRWFGAKGDDLTDNATAINNAYAAAAAAGYKLFIPGGIYRVSSSLTWDQTVTVQGPQFSSPPFISSTLSAVIKPTSAVSGTFITLNAGTIDGIIIDGQLTADVVGVLIGSSLAGNVTLKNSRIHSFGGSSGRGLKVRQAVAIEINRVNIQACGTNLEITDIAADGTPSTAWFRNCYISESTVGPGVLFKGGAQIVFSTCIFESNKQQGFYVTTSAIGDSTGHILKECFFEDNWHGDPSLTNYQFEQYSPGAGVGFCFDGVRFQGGSAAGARPMRLWQARACTLKRIFIPTPITPNMIRIEEINSEVLFDGPLYALAGLQIPYADAVVNADSAPAISKVVTAPL